MTPFEIALRCTRPLSPEEARRQLMEDPRTELGDPCPTMQSELREFDQQSQARETKSRLDRA